MTTIKDRMLQFKSMIKKAIVTNHTFFAVITFSRINFFAFSRLSFSNTTFIRSYLNQFQKIVINSVICLFAML